VTSVQTRLIWILISIAIFLFFSLSCLELPGLHYDEANFADAALGKVKDGFVAYHIEIFGKKLPLMVMNYIGAVKSALYAPIFRIFGTGVISVRAPVIVIGSITLLTSFLLYRSMFGGRIAVIGLLLFAADPTFIFSNKLDWGPVSLMLALEVASLYFLWRWKAEKKRIFLGFAGFILGLGLYNKIIFIWYITAVFCALLLLFREDLKQLLRRSNLILFLPALILGCFPLIVFNIDIPLGTFRHQQVAPKRGNEIFNHGYHLFRGTLDGSGVFYFINQEELTAPSSIIQTDTTEEKRSWIRSLAGLPWIARSPLPLFLAGSMALILALWSFRRLRRKKEILFLMTQLAVGGTLICLAPQAGGAHHAMVIYPFVFGIVAFAIGELGFLLAKSKANIAAAVFLLPLLLSQMIVDVRYLASFPETGGVGNWSDAIYELSDFVRLHPEKNTILMDWGFGNQFSLLGGKKLRKEDFICVDGNPEICMESLLARTDSLLVFHIPPFETRPLFESFKQVLETHPNKVRLLKTFFQRDGRPIYAVFEVMPGLPEEGGGAAVASADARIRVPNDEPES
jgi:4-amino-4-deoxy-L-arabinose transferase-like glycosyltransferase